MKSHLAPGLPQLAIVGLPEAAVRESRDRVRAAIVNSGYQFPNRRITVNLAPADLPKEGGRFDLPIALGILAASEQIPNAQLSNAGSARRTVADRRSAGDSRCAHRGAQMRNQRPPTGAAGRQRSRGAVGAQCRDHRRQSAFGNCAARYTPARCRPSSPRRRMRCRMRPSNWPMCAVNINPSAPLEIAAAGQHSLLMMGPPGSGKSMLAARLPGLLPPMTEAEAVEVAAVASIGSGGFDPQHWGQRPYRAPHHTASGVALVGGGANPRPGEITLAHRGVLFLDELPEFDRTVLEVLREPLESGQITISRAARQVDFPRASS